MEESAHHTEVPFGLWEMDSAGTIRSFEPERGGRSSHEPRDVVGRSFLGEVVPAGSSRELGERLREFAAGEAPAGAFDFTFKSETEGDARARVLLARLRRPSASGGGETLLLHVRRS